MAMRGGWAVVGLGGSVVLAVSGIAGIYSGSAARSGRIVAPEAVLTWRSPARGGSDGDGVEEVRFPLHNAGVRAVRLLSVTQPCACAEQTLSGRVVAPGATAYLTVRPRPMRFGERRVAIEVRTDSPTTPVVALTLHVVGSEKPPFLASVDGHLTFRGFRVGDEAEIRVSTVEPSAREGPGPAVESDLPFLRFDRGGSVVKPIGDAGDAFLRTTSYRVAIAEPPPGGSFFGEVRVTDPRRPDIVKSLQVRGETTPPMRVVPARLMVHAAGGTSDDLPKSFLVVLDDAAAAAPIEAGPDGGDNPFVVEPSGPGADPRRARFVLRRKPGGDLRPGVYRVAISSGGRAAALLVSVGEGSP